MSDDEDNSMHDRVSDSERDTSASANLVRAPPASSTVLCCTEHDSGCGGSEYASEEDEGCSERKAAAEAKEAKQRREANIVAMLTNR